MTEITIPTEPHPLNTPVMDTPVKGLSDKLCIPDENSSKVLREGSAVTYDYYGAADLQELKMETKLISGTTSHEIRNPSQPPPRQGDWFCHWHKTPIHQFGKDSKCSVCDQPKPSDMSCLVTDAPQWWWMHKKGWRPYEQRTSDRIESGYLNGEYKLSVKSGKKGTRPFGVFFDEMLQFDPETKNERGICRSGRITCCQRMRRTFYQCLHIVDHDSRFRIRSLEQYKEQQELMKLSDEERHIFQLTKSLGLHDAQDKSCCSRFLRYIKDYWAAFEVITMSMVLLNAAWIAIEADTNDAPTLGSSDVGYQVVENIFCSFFVVELTIRFAVMPDKGDWMKDPWFRFDFILVVLMIIETWMIPLSLFIAQVDQSKAQGLDNFTVLRLARLVRLTRVSRLARWAPEMMTLLKGILQSVRSVMFTYLLLGFLLYVFGIIFKTLEAYYKGLEESEHFSTMRRSMWTLMIHGLFLDEISGLLNEMQEEAGDFVCFVFILFVILGHFTVLNMVIGFQCEVAQNVSKKDKADQEEDYLRRNLLSIMECYDKNDSKFLEMKEFQLLLQDPDVHVILKRFGTDPDDLEHMAEVIFKDKASEALLGQSRYNEKYYCNILRAEERPDGSIEVDFDAHCDGTIGDLAKPTESILGNERPIGMSLEIDDPRSNLKGTLVYEGVRLGAHSKAMFRFGREGYHYSMTELQIKKAIIGKSKSCRNDHCFCTVYRAEETMQDVVRVEFEAHCGSDWLGDLPDPSQSTMGGKKPIQVIYEDDDVGKERMKGVLLFELQKISYDIPIPFVFASSDYSAIELQVERKAVGCRLSFFETLHLVQRLGGSKVSSVTDIVDLREYVRRLLERKVERLRGSLEDRTNPTLASPLSRGLIPPTPSSRNNLEQSGTWPDTAEQAPAWVDKICVQLAQLSEKVCELERRIPSPSEEPPGSVREYSC